MAPAYVRRNPSTARTEPMEEEEDEQPQDSQRASIWELRRKRRAKKKAQKSTERKLKEAELDPYESDPGESYRDHCMRMRGIGTKNCMPSFVLRTREDKETVRTSPPSPLQSDALEELLGNVPASLPSNLTRVRYSLRSSITDGAEKQPTGPSVMERRELRPNGVHLNVSHWSDAGGRPYMEDRYVIEDMDAVQVEVSPVAVKSDSQDVEVTYGAKRPRRMTLPLTLFACFDGHGVRYIRDERS